MSTEAGRHPKLEEMGYILMDQVPEGVRAYLFLEISEALPLQEIWRSGSRDRGIGGDGKRVLGACMKGGSPVLIREAEEDPQMRGIKSRSFASGLGVPLFDEQNKRVGALFLASDQVEALNEEHKLAVEQVARDYGLILAAMRELPTVEVAAGERPEETVLFSAPALVSAGCGLMLLLIWSIGPSHGRALVRAPEKPAVTVTANQVALDVSGDFLEKLRKEEYDQAWRMLDSSLQAVWPADQFASEFSQWYRSGDHRQVLSQRSINRLQKQQSLAEVVVTASSLPGDEQDWIWQLARRGDTWLIVSIDGPIQSPGASRE